jgi:hypothetical protein
LLLPLSALTFSSACLPRSSLRHTMYSVAPLRANSCSKHEETCCLMLQQIQTQQEQLWTLLSDAVRHMTENRITGGVAAWFKHNYSLNHASNAAGGLEQRNRVQLQGLVTLSHPTHLAACEA